MTEQKAFFVNAEEMRRANYDLSLNRYKETVYIEEESREPEEILAELQQIFSEIQDDLNELHNDIKDLKGLPN